jgi:hypothetical protein
MTIIVSDIQIEKQPAKQAPLVDGRSNGMGGQQVETILECRAAIGFIFDRRWLAGELAEVGLPKPAQGSISLPYPVIRFAPRNLVLQAGE